MFYFIACIFTYHVLYSSIHYTLIYRAHSPYLFTDARVENLGCRVKYMSGFQRVDTIDVKASRLKVWPRPRAPGLGLEQLALFNISGGLV